MKKLTIRGNARCGSECGQMLPLVALSGAVLIALIGLSIDLGFAYVTKARLSKACDAAALAGMQNINQGTTTATQIALAEFYANYSTNKQTGLDTKIVQPTFTFDPMSASATQLTVTASTTIRTFFAQVLPAIGGNSWKTLKVGDTATVARVPVYIALDFDRSSSIWFNPPTPPANDEMYPSVTNFFSYFSDNIDYAGLVTFGTTSGVVVAMSQPFITTIQNNVSLTYANPPITSQFTYCESGLSNAFNMLTGPTIPTGSNVVKAVVFFTDGNGATDANVIRGWLTCGGKTNDVEFGAVDETSPMCYMNPTNGFCLNKICVQGNYGGACSGAGAPGHSGDFIAAYNNGQPVPITSPNVIQEARYRSIQVADRLRANGITVFSIGLAASGNGIEFDMEIANDPAQTGSIRGGKTTTDYDGIFVDSPTTLDLQTAFQRVAEQLSLRLVR